MPNDPAQDPIGAAKPARCNAAVRMADAFLRTIGGGAVRVRVPIPLVTGGDAQQTGRGVIASEDVSLSPVVVRTPRDVKGNLVVKQREVLVSATALAKARELYDAESVEDFFNTALGVFLGTRLFRVVSVMTEEFGGEPFLYRVIVSE